MKIGHLGVMFILFSLGSFGAVASAQTPPAGSYQLNCSYAMAGTTLIANCNNGNQGVVSSTLLNAYECVGNISTKSGTLTCNRGSFRDSCTNIAFYPASCTGPRTISAQCTKSDKSVANAQLTVNPWACNDIANDDGSLMCR